MQLATLLFCAVFSAPIATLLAKLLGEIIFEALFEAEVFGFLEGALAMLAGVTQLVVTMLLAILLYLPIFFLLKAISSRVLKIVCATLLMKSRWGQKKKQPQYLSEEAPFYVRHDRAIGAGVGVLSGLILAVVVFMPLTGLLKTSDDIVDTVAEMTQLEALESSPGMQMIDHYANDASCTVMRACGGRVLYDMTARTTYEGHSTSLNREIETIRSLKIMDRLNEFKSDGQLTGSNTKILEDLLDDLGESLCLKLIMVEFVQNASKTWMQYEPYLGVTRPSMGNYWALDNFFDSILYVCSTTTLDSYDADMTTIFNLIGILEEYQTIFTNNDYETFMTEFVDGDALKRIEDELDKNPRMSRINVAIDDMVMNLIAEEISGVQYELTQQTELYRGIAEILNDAQGLEGSVRTTAISNGIAERFENYGMYLPPALENRVASVLGSQFPSNETITEQTIEKYFAEYTQGSANG